MKKIITIKNAPAAIGPYSQATVHEKTLYVSGQLPIDPATGDMATGDIVAQTHQVIKNLLAIINAAGSTAADVLKVTILLTDMAHFSAVNEVYASYFDSNPPARICYQVVALPKGACVEMDAIAAITYT